MKGNIFVGEEQPLAVAFVRDEYIVVLSENCQDPARVCLARRGDWTRIYALDEPLRPDHRLAVYLPFFLKT